MSATILADAAVRSEPSPTSPVIVVLPVGSGARMLDSDTVGGLVQVFSDEGWVGWADADEIGALADLLPEAGELPAGLVLVADRSRTAAELAATFRDPVEAEARLRRWGWAENIYRRFAAPDGTTPPGGIAVVEVSLSRFRTTAGATTALDHFAEARAVALELQEAAIEPLGDQARAIAGPVANGIEATVYVRRGNIVVRVTAVAPTGDPLADALGVAGIVLTQTE